MTRSITDTLRALRGGAFIDEASDALARLVLAVDARAKSGKLSLELTIKKATRGGAMTLLGKVKVIAPAEPPEETLMFATPEGNLLTEDPRQQKLELKTVPVDAGTNLKTAP